MPKCLLLFIHNFHPPNKNHYLQVHLFVCNEEEDIKYALEVGATGVMTDYPSLLTSYFRRNGRQE